MRMQVAAVWVGVAACAGKGDATSPTDDDDTSGESPTDATSDDDDDTTSDDDDDQDCILDDLTLTVGTGTVGYVPVVSGAPLTMVHGPQGGWHFDLGGEVQGGHSLVSIQGTVTRDDTGVVVAGDAAVSTRLALTGWSAETCTGTFYSVRALLDTNFDQMDVCALAGQVLTIQVGVTDLEDGAVVTEQLTVTAALDPEDVGPCGG